jgi:hypothetical protein
VIPVLRPMQLGGRCEAWRKAAETARNALVRQYHPGDTVELSEQYYKDAMPCLLELFHGKCAYCETVISSNQPGDVEHYRPKGRIRDADGKILRVRLNDADSEHPGYWWLAYDWCNLLPSCIDCNRRRWHGDASLGKADVFVVRGNRAVLPQDDISLENPLLLDPSKPGFDPQRHFEFDPSGTIKPLTDEARHSCELLGLNLREQLVAQRALSYLAAQQAFAFLLSQATTAPLALLQLTRIQINNMWEGRSAYSAFGRIALAAMRDRVRMATGVQIELPLPL